MRVAVYFTPPEDHPLTRAATAWLGRNAFTGQSFGLIAGSEALVAEPRRYGFHATLKAPFQLAEGVDIGEVEAEISAVARRSGLVRIDAMQLEQMGAFIALTPKGPQPRLNALAARVVEAFDRFRAPPSPAEMVRRRASSLTPRQEEYLLRWGYPYVMDEFRFHMTLTGSLSTADQEGVGEELRRRFASFIGRSLAVDSLALFVEPSPGADFMVRTRIVLDDGSLMPMWP